MNPTDAEEEKKKLGYELIVSLLYSSGKAFQG
jgi:hypothetical protein